MEPVPVPTLPELPPETWTEIFAHLSAGQLLKMRRVCRRWRELATSAAVLRAKLAVTFPRTFPMDVDYAPYPALLPVGKVTFEQVPLVGVCSWWPAFGPGLVEFRIRGCSLERPVLVEFLKHTPNVRDLELADIKCTGEWHDTDGVDLGKLENLWLVDFAKGLSIFGNCNLKVLGFTWESIDVSTLEFVNFVGRFQDTLEELYITASEDILVELMKLQRLKLKKLLLNSFAFENNRLIIDLCRKQPLMEWLDLTQILSFDGAEREGKELMEIGELLPRLKFFSVNITPDTCFDLSFVSKMPQLKKLKIDGISGDFPQDVVGQICPNLRTLTFSSIHFVCCSLRKILANMPNLQTLTFEHCTVDTWSDLLKALEPLKLLQNLTLWMTGATTKTYSDFNDLTNLSHLKIYLCGMPPALLATLLKRCPNLRELNLPGMDYDLDEETVRVIGQELPLLNRLTVKRGRLSEAAERFIRENCGSLHVLDITKK